MNAIVHSPAQTSLRQSLEPQNLGEAMRFADMLANSTMVPKDFQGKPANVLVAIQWGREVGLGPLQALQGIAVINGRPSIWGDAALALVQSHPSYGSHKEWVDGEGDQRAGHCTLTRRGHEAETRSFSVADAKKAGLWGKSGPWSQYPDRMLQLRARGFAIRDKFADALRGVITAEEAQDIPAHPAMPAARGPVVESFTAPAPAEVWPVINPSGKEVDAKDVHRWVKWSLAFIATLEDAGALVSWRGAMEANFELLREREPKAVEHVEGAVQERMDALAESPDLTPAAEDR